jgi:hypothetical protein
MNDRQLNYIIIGLLLVIIFISVNSSCKRVEGLGSAYPHNEVNTAISQDNADVIMAAKKDPQLSNQNDENQALEGFGSDHFHRSVLASQQGHENSLHNQNGYPNNDCSQMSNTCAYGNNYKQSLQNHNDSNIQGNIF